MIAALLRAWLQRAAAGGCCASRSGLALERLIAATQVRFPNVADLARGVVYAWFGQPLLRRNRARVYAGVRKNLRYLDENPQAEDRAERDRARWSAAPSRWSGCSVSAWCTPELDNTAMLEVLTRRYYGNKGLTGVRTAEAGGCPFVVAERAGSRLVAAAVPFDRLGDALDGLAELAAVDGAALDADVYLLVGEAAGHRRGAAAACSEVDQRAPAAAPGAPGDRDGRRAPQRGDAPPLHLPAAPTRRV